MFAVQHWNGLGGLLFESDSNKHRRFKLRLLFKLFPGLLSEVRRVALAQIWQPPRDHK